MPLPADCRHRIRILRRGMGLKQPDFAVLVGVSPITISRWENGQHDPTELGWARIQELENRRSAPPVGTIKDGQAERLQLDFGGDPEAVAAVAEAVRLSNGHIASPTFATEISLIDPLPHQRVAVYDHILKSWPIRFLLADDAGAGKTIMTGLTIRELLSRRMVQRVLIVPPAGLVGNWQRELRNLFRIRAGRPARVKLHGKKREHGHNSYDFGRERGDLVRLRYGVAVYCVQSWHATWNARRIGY